MAFIQIPCDNSIIDQKFQTELEGTIYTFKIRWNNRANYWIMSISKQDDTEIINGIPLVLGADLLGRFKSPDLPKGRFVFLDTSNQNLEATINDLNDRCILLYIESTTDLTNV